MTTMGKVYFIECAGRIKIGYTADVSLRLKALSTGSAHDMHLLCAVDGSVHFEKALHRHLKCHRTRGEWFADCLEVRATMQSVLDGGSGSIGFVEPPAESKPSAPTVTNPYESPLRQIRRIDACMDRYLSELVAAARSRETSMELEPGTLINPLIGGYYSTERAVLAFAMIRSAIDSMQDISDVMVNDGWREHVSKERPFLDRMTNIAVQLENGLQKLFADPVPALTNA